jgi:M6 family metalloprotease-like protein
MSSRNGVSMLALFLVAALTKAQDAKGPDLSEFKTVETALTTKLSKAATPQVSSPGYLGVAVAQEGGKLVVGDVEENSPAAKAGVKTGDVILKFDGRTVANNPELFRGLVQAKVAGESFKLTVTRGKETLVLSPALIATSRIMQANQKRAVMGVQIEDDNSGGALLKSVTAGMPADKAGLKAGDVILKVNDKLLGDSAKLTSILADHKPGDTLKLLVKGKENDKDREVKVTLAPEDAGGPVKGKGFKGGGGLGWDTRSSAWKKDTYRLAIVCVEYPDVKHNDKITSRHWEESLFSAKKYVNANATGQRVFGSLNDYYQEQSFGKLKVEGKCFDFVTASKKRSEYAAANTGAAKTALLGEALDALYKRDGKDALKNFDGIFFLYAGDRVQTNRGGLYWPHKSFFTHQGQRWPYFIVQEGGARMCDISVICHEFGHMLGLPDLYARPENPGSEGVGSWCAMSNQSGGGKPQHFSAWSKEQLGWVTPAIIDPTVKQKLILAPIEDSAKECFKVLARPDGSEYFLLENRRKKGFDASLPGEGLLIWRVVQGRPILEESHGIDGPAGPRVFLDSVPFPSAANRSFTPYTTPSSRAQMGGGLPVHITNIRRLADGRITFYVGYEYY